MGNWHRRVVIGAVLVLLPACLEPRLVPCGDLACPSGSVCVVGELCATSEQLLACNGYEDGATCALGGAVGRCDRGVCVASGCGNRVVDPGEVCDDGNTTGGDDCSADCKKLEMCGDGFVDVGEKCDDANANPADQCDACGLTSWQASVRLGGPFPATTIGLAYPSKVAVDRAGNLYIADERNHRIRKVLAGSGLLTTVAGTGVAGSAGDGGPATDAQLYSPYGVAVDGAGNLFIADTENHRIRQVVAATGEIHTVAGNGADGTSGDGGLATLASMGRPYDVAVDGAGNLFIADTEQSCVRMVATNGIITTIVGDGTDVTSGDDGPASQAQVHQPHGVDVDAAGNVYIATDNRIRKITATTGIISTVAGTGSVVFSGDGGVATSAGLRVPIDVAVGATGNLYIAEIGSNRVRRVDATTRIITTIAGTGVTGYGGDGGPATSAQLATPRGAALDAEENVYIADLNNNRVRRVASATGVISTVAGTGGFGYAADGSAATSATLIGPQAVATDVDGNVFIADSYNRRIRRVDAGSGVTTTVAGTGTNGNTGDGGPATAARFSLPSDLAFDAAGNMYVVDSSSQVVRRIAASTGIITTVAGNGTFGYSGDDGPATSAQFKYPAGIAVDGAGNLYIADSFNHAVRMVDATSGIITTIAGTGVEGFSGDDGPATSAQLSLPMGVVVDGAGAIYIADSNNHRVRKIVAGEITTVVGTGAPGSDGDNGLATAATLSIPAHVTFDADGNLYISDKESHVVRRVAATTNIITTVAGVGTDGFTGDGGPATAAQLSEPRGIALDPTGHLYIADSGDSHIRKVSATTGVISSIAGVIGPERMGPLSQAALADPGAIARLPGFTLVAGGSTGTLQAIQFASSWVDVVVGRYPQATATGTLARFRDQGFGDIGGVAYDAAGGRVFLSETTAHRIDVVTIVDPDDADTWTIATLAGDATVNPAPAFADGIASAARFASPTGLYFDEAARILYVADTDNHVVRSIPVALDGTAGTVATIAGTPETLGFFGDGAAASTALLYGPRALVRCANGDMFVADTTNQRVRRIEAGTGVISTVLGDGVPASSGQGTPARDFPVDTPLGLACDAYGNLFITSRTTVRMVPADDAHVVDGTGPVQLVYGAPPRDSLPATVTSCLTGISTVDDTTVQVTDACTGLLVELQRQVMNVGP